jgi:hypothetical protein
MGCDIHFFVEKFSADKDYEGPKGVQEERNAKLLEVLETESEPRWITADSWEYLDEDEGDEYAYWSVVRDKRFYAGRNYYLFTILAGVRGNRDDDKISEPRGVPDDISDAYREQLRQWEGDAHSKSYFTLKELLDVDWSKYEIEYIPEFFETIEKMKQLDTDPEKVRCLFFFDN